MCLLVTRAPNSSLATSSLEELDTVERLFTLAASNCRAASNNLVRDRRFNFSAQVFITIPGVYQKAPLKRP
jgi:hypothetical protein